MVLEHAQGDFLFPDWRVWDQETSVWRQEGISVFPILGNHDLHLLAVSAGNRDLKPTDSLEELLAADDSASLLKRRRT